MTMRHFLIPVLAFAFLAVSCGKDEAASAYSQQESNIESIVQSLTGNNDDATVDYLDGSVRVTVVHGEGEALKEGGTVTMKYAGYRVIGSSLDADNLFVTNDKDFAESSNWTVTDSTVFKTDTFKLNDETFVKGLKTGMVGVKAGDECVILFSGKHGFGKHTTGVVPGKSALAYHLWISSVAN